MVYQWCLECRGTRDMCRKGRCELLEAVRSRLPPVRKVGKVVEGPSPPDVFVGQWGYPAVGVGPLVPPMGELANPGQLSDGTGLASLSMEELVASRSLLIHPRQVAHARARRTPPRLLEVAREVAMSVRPVDTEVVLSREPPTDMLSRFDPFAPPMGPSVEAERGRVVGSASVPRRVEQLVSDDDASTTTLAVELQHWGASEDHIRRLMSVGLLGRAPARRIVPTRWSITAVDDILSRALSRRVKRLQELGELRLYSGSLHGNHFHVLLLPRPWSYEMVEAWVQGSLWTAKTCVVADREGPGGRRKYARNVTGAYYAARLAVLEHLRSLQRQASVVIYREVTEDYWAPLGVWVIREGVRSTLRGEAERPVDLASAVAEVSSRVRVKDWHLRSEHLREAKTQRKLHDFDGDDG